MCDQPTEFKIKQDTSAWPVTIGRCRNYHVRRTCAYGSLRGKTRHLMIESWLRSVGRWLNSVYVQRVSQVGET